MKPLYEQMGDQLRHWTKQSRYNHRLQEYVAFFSKVSSMCAKYNLVYKKAPKDEIVEDFIKMEIENVKTKELVTELKKLLTDDSPVTETYDLNIVKALGNNRSMPIEKGWKNA